jgi:hypothetical protein
MKTFIKDGVRVIGLCQGQAVIGTVESSRLYGGSGKRIVYTVKLEEPIELRWRTEPVDTVLLGKHEIKVAPL